jgi:hypothetical protein
LLAGPKTKELVKQRTFDVMRNRWEEKSVQSDRLKCDQAIAQRLASLHVKQPSCWCSYKSVLLSSTSIFHEMWIIIVIQKWLFLSKKLFWFHKFYIRCLSENWFICLRKICAALTHWHWYRERKTLSKAFTHCMVLYVIYTIHMMWLIWSSSRRRPTNLVISPAA